MIAGKQNLGHFPAMPNSRAAVLGILQQAVIMALVLEAFRVSQHTGNHAAHRIGYRHGSDFTAGENEIAQADLFIHALVNEALVDTLVVAADQDQIVHLAQPNGIGLGEGLAAGGHIDSMHRTAGLVADRFPAAVQRIRGHYRASPAAIGIVVHLILLIGSIIPDLVGLDADDAPVLGPAQNTLRQHIPQSLREKGHDINSHRYAYPRSA